MRVRIHPGSGVHAVVGVPGDKSISHRWLILAATANGRSVIHGLPPSLDVLSSAMCLAAISPRARPGLDAWARGVPAAAEGHGSTWNLRSDGRSSPVLEVEGEGRDAVVAPSGDLHCGNSATAMRLLAGVVSAGRFRSVLTGDDSLSSRPMERVAAPLRAMGASVATSDGCPPIVIDGGPLKGIQHRTRVPSAQVKGAVLLAGLAADGATTVEEPLPTRDHTERALAALGAPVRVEGTMVSVERFQHRGLEGAVPGDPSSAAFLVAAAALTGSRLEVGAVGLNPTRTRFLDVMARMGIKTEQRVSSVVLDEPAGSIDVLPGGDLVGVRVEREELPLVIDEIPVLAMLASHARGETWFLGAGELRVKESDRLAGLAEGIHSLGGDVGDEGEDLVVAGGGLRGGVADPRGDHRLAMAFAVAALAADAPSVIEGVESADVSL